MDRVSILHCGGDEELQFIQYLEQSLASHPEQYFAFEYTTFEDNQAKEVVIFNDTQKYNNEKVPMIVLLSKSFFELIWVTAKKQPILNIITSYSTEKCLHIWLDITEDDVKRRSCALLRRDGQFRIISADDLTENARPSDIINKIRNLLSENDDLNRDPVDNYDVDDNSTDDKGKRTDKQEELYQNYSVDGEEERMRSTFIQNKPSPLLVRMKKIFKVPLSSGKPRSTNAQ